jgi:hypothetical protein
MVPYVSVCLQNIQVNKSELILMKLLKPSALIYSHNLKVLHIRKHLQTHKICRYSYDYVIKFCVFSCSGSSANHCHQTDNKYRIYITATLFYIHHKATISDKEYLFKCFVIIQRLPYLE